VNKIIGHRRQFNFLQKSVEKDAFSQAYIFSGPENVGKLSMAKLFAEGLISGRKMAENESGKILPDLLIVQPIKEEKDGVIKEKDISIEQIREARQILSLFPYNGKRKVLIVNDAEKMTTQAQNSLLKLLEEPNSTSICILIAHNSDSILMTVKSRCQQIRFNLVPDQELAMGIGKPINDDAIFLAAGRPGLMARMLDDEKELNSRSHFKKTFLDLPSYGINEKLKLAEKYAKNMPEAIKTLELWMYVAYKNNFHWENISQIGESLERMKKTNTNGRLVLENLFLNLTEN